MNILVLGHKGMLGHIVAKYLRDKNHNVDTIESKFPTEEFFSYIKTYNGDYIVNCIGAIPQKTNEFDINFKLPIWLSDNVNCRVIHPGTDCEIDNDPYGISKKIARDYIVDNSTNTKIIRSSIIGPELNSNASLLNWFLSNTDSVNGYTNAMWNGITTLEWIKQCIQLIYNWDSYNTETVIASNCISKYQLLHEIKLSFNKSINILPINKGEYKCLNGDIIAPDIKLQLQELKEYYYDNRHLF